MINVNAAVAIVVLVILFGPLSGILWWTKAAPPQDDGVGGQWADYLPEPLEDEGWVEPPPRTKPPWERDEPATPSPHGDPGSTSDGSSATARSDDSRRTDDAGTGDQPGGTG